MYGFTKINDKRAPFNYTFLISSFLCILYSHNLFDPGFVTWLQRTGAYLASLVTAVFVFKQKGTKGSKFSFLTPCVQKINKLGSEGERGRRIREIPDEPYN